MLLCLLGWNNASAAGAWSDWYGAQSAYGGYGGGYNQYYGGHGLIHVLFISISIFQ